MRRYFRIAIAASLGWLVSAEALLAQSQEPGSGGAQQSGGPSLGVGITDMVTVILGLIFVVGLIFAFAWVVRRFNGGTAANSRLIEVLAVTPLGAKEKLVLARVGEQQVLLGVTPHQITRLAELDEPVDTEAHPEGSPFARQLGALIRGKEGSTSQRR